MTDDSGSSFDARETLSRATESDWRHVFTEADLLAREAAFAAEPALTARYPNTDGPVAIDVTPLVRRWASGYVDHLVRRVEDDR